MTAILDQILAANRKYAAEFGEKGNLGVVPARHCAILTCMDARLDPARFAGLSEGDAHIIRNAGGHATDDAIRSLVLSNSVGDTVDWLVIHHTKCAALNFDASLHEHEYRERLAAGVRRDVEQIAEHPLVPENVSIYGFVYDVSNGTLNEVPQAQRVVRERAA